MIQKITAPTSWGALGVLVIALGLMEPTSQPMVWVGVGMCAIGLVRRQVKR